MCNMQIFSIVGFSLLSVSACTVLSRILYLLLSEEIVQEPSIVRVLGVLGVPMGL